MTITKKEVLQRVETYPARDPSADPAKNEGNPTIMVVMEITFDDTEDAELPAISNHVSYLSRYDDQGNPTDVTKLIQIVQDICAAIWK